MKRKIFYVHKNKLVAEVEERKSERSIFLMRSNRSVGFGVLVMLLLQNNDFWCDCALGYEDYRNSRLINELWSSLKINYMAPLAQICHS